MSGAANTPDLQAAAEALRLAASPAGLFHDWMTGALDWLTRALGG